MQRMKISGLAALAGLLTLGALGGLALADDGGVMQRLMGHDAYAGMVSQMRGILGQARADQMLAACDTAMAGAAGEQMMGGGTGSMMGGDMGAMMRSMMGR